MEGPSDEHSVMVRGINSMDETPIPVERQSSARAGGEEIPRPSSRPAQRRRVLWRRMGTLALAVATLAIAALFAVWFFEIDFGDQSHRIIRAYATEHRQVDLRFPGAGYRPYRTTRPMDEGYDFTAADLATYEEELKGELQRRPGDSDALFAMAEVCLLRLQPLQAIDILERLRLFAPKDARILGALAYGNYLVYRSSKETRDLLRSVDLFEAALAESPEDPVLLFNAGTVAQRAKLRDQAKARYTRFLALESDTGWAAEVKLRLRELDEEAP